jgi:hypothetical protein
MNGKQILKLVKEDVRFKEVCFPRDICFHLDENAKTLHMELAKPCKNMQDDSAAFEGWILCIKSALTDKVSRFVLSWEKFTGDKRKPNGKITPEFSAYQRFLFRVKKFQDCFADIISINKDMDAELECSLVTKGGSITLSAPSGGKDRAKDPATGEAGVERKIILSYMPRLAEVLGVEFNECDNQFPVGLFLGCPTEQTAVMPARKSAIDLWGVDKSGATHLFELKIEGNKKVGIISELLFYAYIIADVQKGHISYPKKNRPAAIIHETAKGKINVKAHFLVSELHPFITSETIDLINRHLVPVGISFDALKFGNSYEFAPYSWTKMGITMP